MRKSLILRQQLRDSIKSEIADRTKIHQTKIAAYKTARARPLLANGDSWFDYPLDGNGISLSDTDIIAQLGSMGTVTR